MPNEQVKQLWNGSEKQCTKCDGKEFLVNAGGSRCCAWIDFKCVKCGTSDTWDLGTGEC